MKAQTVAMFAVLFLFALVPVAYAAGSGEWSIDDSYAHQHNTASHSTPKICGDHICKPGEKYAP